MGTASRANEQADPSNPGFRPEVKSEEEIRFAVVMYGGVSLAIYINGVAQELFNMVCATAPETRDGASARLRSGELKGSQRVYRKLGQYLLDWQTLYVARDDLSGEAQADFRELTAKLVSRCGVLEASAEDPINTRFIVDVLSGTSAGGINSIYLAKALANTQGLEGIKKLWIAEGDMAKLINDHVSVGDIQGLAVADPPRSLLNSQRMYRKLLDALAGMEREKVGETPLLKTSKDPAKEPSPLVDELDLFITTTDIRGLTMPITLTDGVNYEKRHRNVFHFRFEGGKENDFIRANDPFLAYAARCTSSFPFAFEPMALGDIEKCKHPEYANIDAGKEEWQKFYSDYWRASLIEVEETRLGDLGLSGRKNQTQESLKKDFLHRAFGDGGYLDNKPFSYATSMLMRRRADVPVRRKLLYVEPVPQHPELDGAPSTTKPDFAENVRAALLELPTKEMIREDIERVLDRNRLLRRVSVYTRDLDSDVEMLLLQPTAPGEEKLNTIIDRFEEEERALMTQCLSVLLKRLGLGYGAYHRLRLDAASARLSSNLSRSMSLDPQSSGCAAIREVVGVWRAARYNCEGTENKKLETEFLLDFDFEYPLRRLCFMSRRINELAKFNSVSKRLLNVWWASDPTRTGTLEAHFGDLKWLAAFRGELGVLKKSTSEVRAKWRTLDETDMHQAMADVMGKLQFDWKELVDIIELPMAQRKAKLDALVAGTPALDQLADELKKVRRRAPLFSVAAGAADAADAASVARECIDFYWRRYVLYDMISYPVQYGTGSTEANEIEVFRISPEDSTGMIDECNGSRRKLAGTAVMNFGAFLEESWRRNDMLWGRLDAAERIICAVMPIDKGDREGTAVRHSLIREAQEAILEEDVLPQNRKAMETLLVTYLSASLPQHAGKGEQLAALKKVLDGRQLSCAMESVIQSCLKDESALWQYFSETYAVDRRVNAEQSARSISRATTVTARMLQTLAREQHVNDKPFAWLAMFGSMFWGIVEVAVPQSLWNLLWKHWVGVLYLVDLLVIAGGIVLAQPTLSKFGWIALAGTIGLHTAVSLMSYYIGGANGWVWRLCKFLLKAVIAAVVAGGVYFWLNQVQSFIATLSFSHERWIAGCVGAIVLGALIVRDAIRR